MGYEPNELPLLHPATCEYTRFSQSVSVAARRWVQKQSGWFVGRGEEGVDRDDVHLRLAVDSDLLDAGHEPRRDKCLEGLGGVPEVGDVETALIDGAMWSLPPAAGSPSQLTTLRT